MFPGPVCFREIAPTDTECKYYVNYLWRRPPSAKLHPKRGAKNKRTGDTYCLRRTSSDKLKSNAIIICQHTDFCISIEMWIQCIIMDDVVILKGWVKES